MRIWFLHALRVTAASGHNPLSPLPLSYGQTSQHLPLVANHQWLVATVPEYWAYPELLAHSRWMPLNGRAPGPLPAMPGAFPRSGMLPADSASLTPHPDRPAYYQTTHEFRYTTPYR